MPQQIQVRIYTKPGCHLCEEAKAEILKAGCGDSYVLEEVNIENDADLFKRFGLEVPVIALDGIVTFKYRVSAADFKRQIERARRG